MRRPEAADSRGLPGGTRLGVPRGFTLVELLVATSLTLLLMAAVVSIFASIGKSVDVSRAVLEMADRQRAAAARLQKDLQGLTVIVDPPCQPAADEGYFELIEGPVGAAVPPQNMAWNAELGVPDTSVGDFDDILMFTTRTTGRPFVGRFLGSPSRVIQSDVAEVAWFVRGRTLYRRVLLVVPGRDLSGLPAAGFFADNDISVRLHGQQLVANSLGDLTRRECRFGHDVRQFPFDVRGWGQLGLPTLRECSAGSWVAGNPPLPGQPPLAAQIDFWSNNLELVHPWPGVVEPQSGAMSGYLGPRVADDVILTNVIGFDVKVWDPGAGKYVDLGSSEAVTFALGRQHPRSMLQASANQARIYDTWSDHYEHDGFDQNGNGIADEGTDGFDNDGNGLIDDPLERETWPPYPLPLRGIQVKIRCFERDSRQIREVTVVQQFLPR